MNPPNTNMAKDLSKYHIPDDQFVYKKKRVFQFVKRGFDIFNALLALILLSPLLIIVAIIIKCYDRGPVFFKQERMGKDGKKFKMIKFRSMRVGAEGELHGLMDRNEASGPLFKIKDDPRITKPGKFIRKTSIDELPQLFNILGGSMSFVGPRPALEREVEAYKFESDKWRMKVKPGLTCIWQVSGRSNLPFAEQVEMDKYYIVHRNVFLDLKILLLTVPAVLTSDGAE